MCRILEYNFSFFLLFDIYYLGTSKRLTKFYSKKLSVTLAITLKMWYFFRIKCNWLRQNSKCRQLCHWSGWIGKYGRQPSHWSESIGHCCYLCSYWSRVPQPLLIQNVNQSKWRLDTDFFAFLCKKSSMINFVCLSVSQEI